jgi:selenocysteine-specific elongation factor
MPRFILATAGHVDHGKSALVKALTGIDPDRLPEEKARGITIDLGFAHLELDGPPPGPNAGGGTLPAIRYQLGIVDVPGHEDFVKNMVAGVGSIDLALLIVAADDGWMPQTEEHLQILSYLGVGHAVVALTKIDLAAEREPAVVEAVRQQLQHSPFADAPIVPTSVLTGLGLEELKAALVATLATMSPASDVNKPRLPVDRVFSLHGIGTVVTGTLTGGVLRRNQGVVLQPSGTVTRVRSLQIHNRDADAAEPGTRTALNLPDVPLATASSPGLRRGEVVTVAELGSPTCVLDVWLEKSSRLRGDIGAARPLKDGVRVRVHHGSNHAPGRVFLMEHEPLGPGARGLAQLRMDRPIFVLGGDHFILRDWPGQHTVAGGVVLDTNAVAGRLRGAQRRARLQARADHPDVATVWIQTELEAAPALRQSELLRQTRFSSRQVQPALASLAEQRQVRLLGEWALRLSWWEEQCAAAARLIQTEHQEHPERPGLALVELRRHLAANWPDANLFELLLTELRGFVPSGTTIRHEAHRPALPPPLQAAGTRLRAALDTKPFEPPARKELARDAVAQQALRFLLDTGEAAEISADLVMLAEHLASAREAIRRHLQQHGTATASDLRQLLGTNRRVIIPLLERLDRDGLTVRRGDARVLR